MQSKARANVLLDLNEEDGRRPFSVQDIVRMNGANKVMAWRVCIKYYDSGNSLLKYQMLDVERKTVIV